MKLTEEQLRSILEMNKEKLCESHLKRNEAYEAPSCDKTDVLIKVTKTPTPKDDIGECSDNTCTCNRTIGYDENNDFKTPYEKMSDEEKAELKDLLEKSNKISQHINLDKNQASSNEPLMRNEKLILDWKDYNKRVQKFMEKHNKLPEYIVKAFMLDEYPEEKPVDDRPWEVQQFESITKKMYDTYMKKNADYGNSFDDLFDEFGMTSALLRIKDKYNRLKSLMEKKDIQVKDESIEDTLMDMANYAILTIIKLRKDKRN